MSNFVDYGNMTSLMTALKSAIDNAGGGGGGASTPVVDKSNLSNYESLYLRGSFNKPASANIASVTPTSAYIYDGSQQKQIVNNVTIGELLDILDRINAKSITLGSALTTYNAMDYSCYLQGGKAYLDLFFFTTGMTGMGAQYVHFITNPATAPATAAAVKQCVVTNYDWQVQIPKSLLDSLSSATVYAGFDGRVYPNLS